MVCRSTQALLSLAYITEKFPTYQMHAALVALSSRMVAFDSASWGQTGPASGGKQFALIPSSVASPGPCRPVLLQLGPAPGEVSVRHSLLLADYRRPKVIPAPMDSSSTYLDSVARTLTRWGEGDPTFLPY